jgi:thiol-disulfide isomerase/thioredoxin/uncharacterized protein YeaO (DUF488 family)
MKPKELIYRNYGRVRNPVKLTALLLCLFAVSVVLAKDIVINNPVVDFYPGGISHVVRIELTDSETRVHILDKFISGWWVSYSSLEYLEDCESGTRWQVKDIINGEFDKRLYMSHPGSGDSLRILVFPPLPKNVKRVNRFDITVMDDAQSTTRAGETSYTAYGISLDPKEKAKPETVPADVLAWFNAETDSAKRKTMFDIDGGEFFVRDTVRIVGYIKGYDSRSKIFSASVRRGKLFNNPADETGDSPITVFPDGRFQGSFELDYPQYLSVLFNEIRTPVNIYVEPGQTLSLTLDWEEFRKADRMRNISYTFTGMEFGGAAAGVNSELCAFNAKLPYYNTRNIERWIMENPGTPASDFMKRYDKELGNYNAQFNKLLETEKLSPLTRKLLTTSDKMKSSSLFMRFSTVNRDKVTDVYYAFMHDFPKNDLLILSFPDLISNFTLFIQLNEQTYMKPLTMEKTEAEYIFGELGLTPDEEDGKYMAVSDSMRQWVKEKGRIPDRQFIEEYMKTFTVFQKKYEKQMAEYMEKYVKPQRLIYEKQLPLIQDSVYTNVLKIKPSLLYSVFQAKNLYTKLETQSLTAAEQTQVIKDFAMYPEIAQMLISESFRTEKLLTEETPMNKNVIVNEAPEVENEKLMEAILEKYGGKVVFVDFWATWCGPCRSSMTQIKPLKGELQEKGVVFLYITNESSPVATWKRMLPDIHGEHYRLNAAQWKYLSDRFGIKGIPHYHIYDSKGNMTEQYTGYPGNNTVEAAIEKIL